MTRTAAREIAIHLSFGIGLNPGTVDDMLDALFEDGYYATLAEEADIYSDYPDERQMEYIRRLAKGLGEHTAELDSYIEKYAQKWRISRISRVAVAVMRTAMFEVMYMPDIPNAAAINEAVELSKKYEEPETVSFINGVLGSFIRGEYE